MLRVAIVGCGKAADAHASQIQRIRGCEIVGVCDREELMARQLYERSRARQYFRDIEKMLSQAQPDVVHLTTPPQSHYGLAKECLGRGCHVYVEQPFTMNLSEAQDLIACAEKRGLKITVGHDNLFSPAARRMRELVYSGYLGDRPLHMESYYCYEPDGAGCANALFGDKNHRVRHPPPGLLHRIISPAIARIAEFLITDAPEVKAVNFRRGEDKLDGELRSIITEDGGTTAYFTLSSHMKPSLNEFRILGGGNGLLLDQRTETLIKLKGERYGSYLEHFISPLDCARQYVENAKNNIGMFLAKDFHMKGGKKYLIQLFYYSIDEDAPLPVSYREILLTARIVDEIFRQIKAQTDDCEKREPVGRLTQPLSLETPYLPNQYPSKKGLRPCDPELSRSGVPS